MNNFVYNITWASQYYLKVFLEAHWGDKHHLSLKCRIESYKDCTNLILLEFVEKMVDQRENLNLSGCHGKISSKAQSQDKYNSC